MHHDLALLHGLAFHHRALLAGSREAANSLASMVNFPLNRFLQSQNIRVPDPAILTEAADDAVLDYLERPEKVRASTREGVWSFLTLAARRNVIDRLRKDSRQGTIEGRFAVEESRRLEEYAQQITDLQLGSMAMAPDGPPADDGQLPPEVLAVFNEQELGVLRLMRSRERSTETYAEVLGIRHLPKRERVDKTMREKAKIRQRLKRMKLGHLLRPGKP